MRRTEECRKSPKQIAKIGKLSLRENTVDNANSKGSLPKGCVMQEIFHPMTVELI